MDTDLLRKILIPLDSSPLAERAIEHVQRLTSPAKSEIVLVNVIDSVRYSFGAIDFTTPNLVTLIRSSAHEYLAGQRTRLQEAGYQVSTVVVDGEPPGHRREVPAVVLWAPRDGGATTELAVATVDVDAVGGTPQMNKPTTGRGRSVAFM